MNITYRPLGDWPGELTRHRQRNGGLQWWDPPIVIVGGGAA